jgi:hypothetical protein
MAKRYRGHFCWACARTRPNERFSGRGHAKHLCRDCARLPREELEYRRAVRNIEPLVRSGWLIPRKHRARIEQFIAHSNERVRQYAKALLDLHDREIARLRAEREAEERAFEAWFRGREEASEMEDPTWDDPPF